MQHRTRIAVFGTVLAAAAVGFTAPGALAAAPEGITITKVTVNDGKPVALGTTAGKTFKVSVTADTDSAITESDITLFGPDSNLAQPQTTPKCTTEGTKATCTGTFTIDPDVDFYDNKPAGTWYVNPLLVSDTDSIYAEKAGKFNLQRESKLTVNASPEPIKKGKTLTVTGALTRANWETHKYSGYTGQSVTLEYKKKGASAYTAVKTVKTDNKGNLKTTVKASADGYYRYSFAGTSTAGAVKAAGDYVDVR
ncbi:calcium-binding protein [Streptomyces spectabilis]|uniref:calcium-binding protein n=1 Tax=Streptomyces spectabilis TaxID=68270 RepID=UPI003400AC2F